MSDRSVAAGDVSRSVIVTGDGNRVSLVFGDSGMVLPLVRRQVPAPDRRRRLGPGEARRELDVLVADRRAAPLVGRDELLAELVAWLEDDIDISVRALTGRAGSGKTRLAIELCRAVDGGEAVGDWAAGFLPPAELAAVVEALATRSFDWERPTLLVLDYAAQVQGALARWLDRLVTQGRLTGRLRLLLLEREAPEGFGWWKELTTPASSAGAQRTDLFWDAGLRPVELPGLTELEDRRQVLAATLAAAAGLRGTAAPAAIPAAGADAGFDAALAGARFGNPLSLMMAGVLALDRPPREALALRRLDAARHLAARELRRLGDLAGAGNAAAMRHLAAFNGLAGGLAIAGLRETLAGELAAAGIAGDAARVATLLQQELPAPPEAAARGRPAPRHGAARPGRRGADRGGAERRAHGRGRCGGPGGAGLCRGAGAGRAGADAAPAGLCLCARGRDRDRAGEGDRPPADALADRACRGGRRSRGAGTAGLCLARGDAGAARGGAAADTSGWPRRSGPPIGRATIRRPAPAPPSGSTTSATASPTSGSARRRWRRRRRRWTSTAGSPPPGPTPSPPTWRCRSTTSATASPPSGSARRRWRRRRRRWTSTAGSPPPGPTPSPPTWRARSTTSATASPTSGSARRRWRRRRRRWTSTAGSPPPGPTPSPPTWRASLNNLGNRLSDLGQREAALAAAQEAVGPLPRARRRPARRLHPRPGDVAQQPRQPPLRPRAARGGAGGGAGGGRTSTAGSPPPGPTPSPPTWRRRSTTSATASPTSGGARRRWRRRRRRWTSTAGSPPPGPTPSPPTWRCRSTTSANRLSDLGQREAALAAAQEAVELYRGLAAARPDAFTPDLAMSLNNLGNCLSDLGRREAALAAAQEAVDLYRGLAAARPDAFTPDLASVAQQPGEPPLRPRPARGGAGRGAGGGRPLPRGSPPPGPTPSPPTWRCSLNNLGDRLSDLGRREEALAAAQEAVDLYRGLAAARPDAFTVDLSRLARRTRRRASGRGRSPRSRSIA